MNCGNKVEVLLQVPGWNVLWRKCIGSR